MAVSTPTLVKSFAASAAALTHTSAAIGSTVPAGTFLLATVVGSSFSATLTFSDSKTNTWTALTQQNSTGSGAATSNRFFYTVVTNALTSTDTFTANTSVSGTVILWVESFAGVNTTTPIDQAVAGNTNATANTAWLATSITPVAGSLVYAAGGIGIATFTSPAAGFTNDQNLSATGTARTAVSIYQQMPTSSTVTPGGTLGSTAIWECMRLSLNPATASIRRPPAITNRAAILRASTF